MRCVQGAVEGETRTGAGTAQQWSLGDRFDGSICIESDATKCFNVQMCDSDLILEGARSHASGCSGATNMAFDLGSDGRLRSRLANRNSSTNCVVVGHGAAESERQLRLGACTDATAAAWSFNKGSSQLLYRNGSTHLCVSAETAPPGPAPTAAAVELWAKPLNASVGDFFAVAVLNRGGAGTASDQYEFSLSELPRSVRLREGTPATPPTRCIATDVWSGATSTVGPNVTLSGLGAQSAKFFTLSDCQ